MQKAGNYAAELGSDMAIITGSTARKNGILDAVTDFITRKGLNITNVFDGARLTLQEKTSTGWHINFQDLSGMASSP